VKSVSSVADVYDRIRFEKSLRLERKNDGEMDDKSGDDKTGEVR